MKRTTLLVAALATLAAGCSLVNAPDRSLIGDGGMDSRVDGDARPDGDARLDGDAGDATGDACPAQESVCGNAEDDDCDGLVDCADPDCAMRTQCCTGGTAGAVGWEPSELDNNWSSLPTGNPNDPNVGDGQIITGFDLVDGIITNSCVPLAAGYRLRSYFHREHLACVGADDCWVSLVLTPAPGASMGSRVPDDLAINLFADGSMTITNAGRVLASRPPDTIVHGDSAMFTLTVTVSADERGQRSLTGTVEVNGDTLVEAEPFAPLDALLRDGPCEAVGGLRLAIEGSGRQFHVGPLDRGEIQCINVSNFEGPELGSDDFLSASSLGWGTWASGGIGAPSLAATRGTPDVWYVLGDGTDYDRSLDGAAVELGYSVGFARASETNWDDSGWPISSGGPKMGRQCHPSCVGDAMGCGEACPMAGGPGLSIRDPSFEQVSVEPSGFATVAYAVRTGVDTYGIAIDNGFAPNGMYFEAGTIPVLERGSTVLSEAVCISLRDPMLVRRNPNTGGEADGYWLFFTCYTDFDEGEIHAIQLNATFGPVAGSHRILLTPEIGAWAASSVWSPEVLVEYEPMTGLEGHHLFRMWFLGRNRTRDRVGIGLVQGQLDAMTAGELPDFEPFDANPVASEGDVLGRDDCDGCLIRGLAVSRVPSEAQQIRFLIARQDDEGRADDWHYAPFVQFWRSPWN